MSKDTTEPNNSAAIGRAFGFIIPVLFVVVGLSREYLMTTEFTAPIELYDAATQVAMLGFVIGFGALLILALKVFKGTTLILSLFVVNFMALGLMLRPDNLNVVPWLISARVTNIEDYVFCEKRAGGGRPMRDFYVFANRSVGCVAYDQLDISGQLDSHDMNKVLALNESLIDDGFRPIR